MKPSSEMLYKYVCNYCKPNVLINFCLENYNDADSNAFLVKDVICGVQLVKDEFCGEKEISKNATGFVSFLEVAQKNTIDIFCNHLLQSLPDKYKDDFSTKIDSIFNDFNKETCNPQSFYDLMSEYRNIEETMKSQDC